MALIDSFGRTIDYLRIGLIDRCNLRCSYCMPERGLDWIPSEQLLSDAEILRLLRITSQLGVTKVRFTGGEPLIRKNVMQLFQTVSDENLFQAWSITTNGVTTQRYLKELKALGLKSINLSLDTLDQQRFLQITRRDHLNDVLQTLHHALDIGIHVKVNMVVQFGINDQDIASMSALAIQHPIDVRFIEEMPFNGGERQIKSICDAAFILHELKKHYSDLTISEHHHGETAQNYTS
ncbi:MAG: GTP 3',8-cyclase MoaA, partial [Flavobacteriales bacterium]